MSAAIVLLVLFAACLHAIWNAIVKSGTDTLLDTVLVTTAAAALALVALPMLPQPAGDSRPYLVASLAAQVIYFRLVAAAYHHGDMSETYPIMRGTAPLLVALASGPFVRSSCCVRSCPFSPSSPSRHS